MNQDIVKYLEEGKKRGFSIQLLKQKLLAGGFQEKDVDDAIAAMNVPQTKSSEKIDLFDKSLDDKYSFTQPTEQKMPIGPAQQFRQLPGQQTTFTPPQSSMQQPAQVQQIQPFGGIQQKQEIAPVKKEEYVKSGAEGRWMMIGGILGILILVLLITGAAMNFLANDSLMGLTQNSLTSLILALVVVLMLAIYSYAFVRVGKKTNQKILILGSWFIVIPTIIYLVLAVIGNMFVYEQAINFFSGTDSEGAYKITFLILAILWVVALLLHVIGMILSAIGMVRAGKEIKMMNLAGIINILVFICGLGFLAGIIIFIYSVLNAFSTPGSGVEGIASVMTTAWIAIYSLVGMFGLKAVAMIFEIIGLFSASKKFE